MLVLDDEAAVLLCTILGTTGASGGVEVVDCVGFVERNRGDVKGADSAGCVCFRVASVGGGCAGMADGG